MKFTLEVHVSVDDFYELFNCNTPEDKDELIFRCWGVITEDASYEIQLTDVNEYYHTSEYLEMLEVLRKQFPSQERIFVDINF